MRFIIFRMCCLWAAVLLACSPVRVLRTEPAEAFMLSNYRTFDFYAVETEGDALSPDYERGVALLKNAVARQLEARGLTRKSDDPDLRVNLGIVVNQKVQTRQTNLQTDPPNYIGQRRYTWKSREVEVGRYRQGTVSVHLVDPRKNELVWQGVAEGVVPEKEAKLEKTIDQGAEALLGKIPE
jgi:hypothetical protein